MKQILTIFLILLISSGKGQVFKYPKIISGIETHGVFKKEHLFGTRREVKYLGPYIDMLYIDRTYNSATAIGNNLISDSDSTGGKLGNYQRNRLEIYLDLKQQVTLDEYDEKINDYRFYKAYPVFINNPTDSVIIIGTDWHIPIALEYKNKQGVWIPTEQSEMVIDCGVGLQNIILKPHYLLCVLVPAYGGNYSAILRYRLGMNYSNEFDGKRPVKVVFR